MSKVPIYIPVIKRATIDPLKVAGYNITDLKGKRLGSLDNGKWNTNKLLDAVAGMLESSYQVQRAVRIKKPLPGKVADRTVIDELKAKSDFVITGVAD